MPYTPHPAETPAPKLHRVRRYRHRMRAMVRDTLALFREFWSALLLFVATLLVGGWLWMILSNPVEPEPVTYLASVYMVLTLVFFQAGDALPPEWYREVFFFLMPIIGLAILGRGAAEFAVQLFNRQSHRAQWEVSLASTFRHHTIVCGMGHVGIRVVRELVAMGEENIVVIEQDPKVVRVQECKRYDIPVIEGDARQPETLADAGLEHADAFIVCTNDDMVNIRIAMGVNELNPNLRLIVRIFDETLGRRLTGPLGFHNVFSASALAAPFFAGAALGTAVTQTFYVEDKVMNMGRVRVQASSQLATMTVGEVEHVIDLSVVLHQNDVEVDLHPNHDIRLEAGDLIVVFASLGGLAELRTLNRPKR